MKVEQALRILPSLEELTPLRALLYSSVVPDTGPWATSGQNVTVGKGNVEPARMRAMMPEVLQQTLEHFGALYEHYVSALECIEADRQVEAVEHLLQAGYLEEHEGHLSQAHLWFGAALGIARGLQNRRPEVDALLALGRVSLVLGYPQESGRHYQRALALAEAEFDQPLSISACEGLSAVAADRGAWQGAQAWLARALRIAEAIHAERRAGRIHHALAELARKTGQPKIAIDELRAARELLEPTADHEEMARVLATEAMVLADLGIPSQAAPAYREALAWSWRGNRGPETELYVRINFAKLLLETGKHLEAEEEIRRAEQLALAGNHIRQLVEVYTILGRLRGQQHDEAGFVFFEQAIELIRTIPRANALEADVYRSYSTFKYEMGETEASKAYLERAREMIGNRSVEA